jgi:hypothetical protein
MPAAKRAGPARRVIAGNFPGASEEVAGPGRDPGPGSNVRGACPCRVDRRIRAAPACPYVSDALKRPLSVAASCRSSAR